MAGQRARNQGMAHFDTCTVRTDNHTHRNTLSGIYTPRHTHTLLSFVLLLQLQPFRHSCVFFHLLIGLLPLPVTWLLKQPETEILPTAKELNKCQ